MKILSILALMLFSVSANATVVGECGMLNSIDLIQEPWEKNTKTFYNGKVRVAAIDTQGEPACCSSHLVLLVPQNDEIGSVSCFVVSQVRYDSSEPSYLGFQSVSVAGITSKYEAGKGLLLSVPFTTYIDGIDSNRGRAKVRINLQKGTVVLE